MSSKEFMKKIIELYHSARHPKYYNPNIFRGRSSSISSELEDLTAFFISLNNPNLCKYFVDQPMEFKGIATKYPDIVIQENNGIIKNLIDVKTDIGWSRNNMYEFCAEWEQNIEKIKGTETTFNNGVTKENLTGKFSEEIKYHILIITKINSGKVIEQDYIKVKNEMKNVFLYILSDKTHPNEYGKTEDEILNSININQEEFDRLFFHIINNSC